MEEGNREGREGGRCSMSRKRGQIDARADSRTVRVNRKWGNDGERQWRCRLKEQRSMGV